MSPLRNRDFRLLLIGAAAVFAGIFLLLPVVPLWVVRQGAGEAAAGASTGVLMASTVAAQFAVPWLVARFGYPKVTMLGALLVGAPAPLLVVAADWPAVLSVSLVRGLGFGLMTVCGSALVAELLPRTALANGSGLYGVAVGLPQLAGLPAGTWAAEHWGFPLVFLVAGALPLLGAVPFALLPAIRAERANGTHWLATVEATWRPWLVMISGSIGFGSLATFLPIVFSGSPGIASTALFAAPAGALVARWLAGVLGDRISGAGRMLPYALALCALGLGVLALSTHSGIPAVAAVAVFGLGFGVLQNDSMVVMFATAPTGPASVVWNVAFDAGTGAGAVVVGALVATIGYPGAFGLLASLAVVLLPVAWAARRAL
ncbi:MFS transporter [Amycolatopsis anabasis]|uniref:MFS transporter n=1 Tax=Amycolatopsis anabasis TaxID=1840409 RepID=UPI001FE4848A